MKLQSIVRSALGFPVTNVSARPGAFFTPVTRPSSFSTPSPFVVAPQSPPAFAVQRLVSNADRSNLINSCLYGNGYVKITFDQLRGFFTVSCCHGNTCGSSVTSQERF